MYLLFKGQNTVELWNAMVHILHIVKKFTKKKTFQIQGWMGHSHPKRRRKTHLVLDFSIPLLPNIHFFISIFSLALCNFCNCEEKCLVLSLQSVQCTYDTKVYSKIRWVRRFAQKKNSWQKWNTILYTNLAVTVGKKGSKSGEFPTFISQSIFTFSKVHSSHIILCNWGPNFRIA